MPKKKSTDKERFIKHLMDIRAGRNKEISIEIGSLKKKKDELKKYSEENVGKEIESIDKEIKRLREEQESSFFKRLFGKSKLRDLEEKKMLTEKSKLTEWDIKNRKIEMDFNTKFLKEELEGKTIRRLLSNLEKMEDVQLVSYRPKMMRILTKPIHLGKHNIGRYWIEIGESITIDREDRIAIDCNGWSNLCHPFVKKSYPCFGALNDEIDDALANGGVCTVAVAAMHLLKCTTPENSGWYVSPDKFARLLKERTEGKLPRIRILMRGF